MQNTNSFQWIMQVWFVLYLGNYTGKLTHLDICRRITGFAKEFGLISSSILNSKLVFNLRTGIWRSIFTQDLGHTLLKQLFLNRVWELYGYKRSLLARLHKTDVCKFAYLFMRHLEATSQHGGGGVVVYFSMTRGVWC